MKNGKMPTDLTSREKEIVSLLADGYSNEEVGQILNISVRTIMSHRSRITVRLNTINFPQLVKYAIKHNLTKIENHRSDSRLVD